MKVKSTKCKFKEVKPLQTKWNCVEKGILFKIINIAFCSILMVLLVTAEHYFLIK